MYLLRAFEYFDPITGDVPNVAHSEFKYIALRARKLLKNTSRKRINEILTQVNQYVLIGETMRIGELKPNQSTFITYALNLRTYFEKTIKRELTNSIELPQYYAVLSLALIGNIFHLIQSKFKNRFEEDVRTVLAEAEEAVSSGEVLSRIEEAEKKAFETIDRDRSRIAHLGGKAKHAKSNAAKCEFIKFHEKRLKSKGYKNKTHTARVFCHLYLKENDIFTSRDSAVRALLQGLRDYEKGIIDCTE